MPSKKTHRSQTAKMVRNRSVRTFARTRVTKAREACVPGSDSQVVKQAVSEAVSALDKAVSKGVIHKNNAARRKSRLMHSQNKVA